MSGLNGVGRMDLVNQPHIICVSMTDAVDNVRSISGPHIDFAAPGWEVYTTTTGGSYLNVSGTSFAAPLFSGIVAAIMSYNPALTATQVIEVLKNTADDKGNPGWDESFGWGRVNYREALNYTRLTLPRIATVTQDLQKTEIAVETKFPFLLTLEKNQQLGASGWQELMQVNSSSNLTIFDDSKTNPTAFYRVRAESAR